MTAAIQFGEAIDAYQPVHIPHLDAMKDEILKNWKNLNQNQNGQCRSAM